MGKCYAGQTCSYDCNNNLKYVKNENISAVICSNTTNRWEPSNPSTAFTTENDLCLARHCTTRIPNGHLSSSCSANVGSVCRYKCDIGYHPNASEIYCRSRNRRSFLTDPYPWITDIITFWSVDERQLCTNSQQCPLEKIPNGKLDAACKRNPGDICLYTCDYGYRATHHLSSQTTIECTSSSTWNTSLSLLCKRIVCSSRIQNGYVRCSNNNYQTKCAYYTCDSGYIRSKDYFSLTCNYKGKWEWTTHSTLNFCIAEDELCSSSIPNGLMSYGCTRREGDMCRYHCTGCRNDTAPDWLTCRNKTWVSGTDYLCMNCSMTTTTAVPVRCPLYMPDGKVYDSCDRAPHNTCNYTCDYKCTKQYTSLRCNSFGEWIGASSACSCTKCPYLIPNGYISNWSIYDSLYLPCNFKPESYCQTNCNRDCVKVYNTDVLCQSSGQWQFADRICDCKESATSNTDNSDGGGSNTVVIVMSVLGIIVLIIIVAGVLRACKWRLSQRPTQSNLVSQSGLQQSFDNVSSTTNNSQDTITLATSAQWTNENVQTNWNQSSPTITYPMQGPPPYSELSFAKTYQTTPPPSYEDVMSQNLGGAQQTFIN